MSSKSLLCAFLTVGALSLCGVAPLKAAPLVFQADTPLSTFSHNFSEPQLPPFESPGSHQDSTQNFIPLPVLGTGVTDYVAWVIDPGGVFTYTPNAAYYDLKIDLILSFMGSMQQDAGGLTTFGETTVTFLGLQGISAGDISVTASVSNMGAMFDLRAAIVPGDDAFSFSGIRIESEMLSGSSYLSFLGMGSAAINATGRTDASVDPGNILEYQAVPEPSSLLLLGVAGAVGLAWRGRARRRKEMGETVG